MWFHVTQDHVEPDHVEPDHLFVSGSQKQQKIKDVLFHLLTNKVARDLQTS